MTHTRDTELVVTLTDCAWCMVEHCRVLSASIVELNSETFKNDQNYAWLVVFSLPHSTLI